MAFFSYQAFLTDITRFKTLSFGTPRNILFEHNRASPVMASRSSIKVSILFQNSLTHLHSQN